MIVVLAKASGVDMESTMTAAINRIVLKEPSLLYSTRFGE
jgi:hypothetical protein